MAQFALEWPDVEYEIRPGYRLRVLRPALRTDIAGLPKSGQPFTFFDSGAPFSIISHTTAGYLIPFLRPESVTLNPLPKYLAGIHTRDVPTSSLLSWEGVACDLRRIDVGLRDRGSGAVAGPLEMLAKVVSRPIPDFYDDRFVILGMDFLAANNGTLTLRASPWGLGGHLAFP